MLSALKRKIGTWFYPNLAEELGMVHEDLAEAELEVLALREAISAAHHKHLFFANTLLDIIGGFVLRDGGESGEVTLSGELRAAAAASPTVTFEELEDGDVVMRIPDEASDSTEDLENDLG